MAPPFPIQQPPADAIKTPSGVAYKKTVAREDGQPVRRNDTVLVNYTGWHQKDGQTFYTNRGRGQPLPINLANAAPGFVEALPQLHKGETAVLWVPGAVGFKDKVAQPDDRVYEIEIVDVVAAPEIPPDVGSPPDKATKLPSGSRYVVLQPGSGAPARQFDTVTYNYTVWTSEGRQLDSSQRNNRPANGPPYKLSIAMAEILTLMTTGEHARFWVDATRTAVNGRTVPGAEGTLCYEVDVVQITKPPHEPPPTPPDVAKPPASAKKTAKGVFYRLIDPGPSKDPRHPQPIDNVKVHYTGWTTDGRMFDTSETRAEPSNFNLKSVIAGWTDGIPLLKIGETMRYWIPEELAYKGQQGKPQGMLVFDVKLVEIVAPTNH